MLACGVKTASTKSIRKLLARADSQSSMSSSCSPNGYVGFTLPDPSVYQGGPLLKEFMHPKNDSLDWMNECNNSYSSKSADSMDPLLFVLDGRHALNFCHFSKPKTFAIRPTSLVTKGTIPVKPDRTPVAPMLNNSVEKGSAKENSFSPLPVFDNRPPNPTFGLIANITAPVVHHDPKLCAANISESREVFLRLASKFWPGPVVFHMQVRMLGGESEPLLSKKLSSSSVASLYSLSSTVSYLDTEAEAINMPVLPPSVLIPFSKLVANQDSQVSERHFVAMQCPSHPLSRKILNEVYRGPSRSNISSVSHSPSCQSLGSISSADPYTDGENRLTQQNASSQKNIQVRSNIAVVGCMFLIPNPLPIAVTRLSALKRYMHPPFQAME